MTANWHPDPTGDHELRYWDGRMWTEHVADQGVQSISPLPTVRPQQATAAETETETDRAAAHEEQERATDETVAENASAEPSQEERVEAAADDVPGPDVSADQPAADEDVAMIHQPAAEQTAVAPVADDVVAGDRPRDDADDEVPADVAEAVVSDAVTDTSEAEANPFGPTPSFTPESYDVAEPIRKPLSAGPVEDAPGADPFPAEEAVDDLAATDEQPGDTAGADADVPLAEEPGSVEDAAETDVVEADVVEAEPVAEEPPADAVDSIPGGEAQTDPDGPGVVDPAVEGAEQVGLVATALAPEIAAATAAAATAPQPEAGPAGSGVSGELIDGRFSEVDGAGVALQNNRLLRVRVGEPFMARQGAMVAYQGDVTFAYQGSGASKFLKKAVTGEGLSLMRVEGDGDVFLADTAKHVHILRLDNGGISLNGANVLAFSAALEWNVERVKGATLTAGGLFNTTLRGTGWVAVTTDGEPVVLNTGEVPTYADTNAVVGWSADLQTSLRSSISAGGLIGRGSGEAIQIAFAGPGFVIVQPSEGHTAPPQ